MADTTNQENKPPQTTAPVEDGWAAARRRLMEGQIWIRLPNMTPNPNVWKEATEMNRKKK